MPQPTVLNIATSQWVHAAAIANPTGGVTIDAEARTATNGILDALRDKGVIAGATALNIGHAWNGATNQVTLGPAIANPTGGTPIDAALRTAINTVLGVLRGYGIIAGGSTGPAFILDEDTNAWSTTAIANLTTATDDIECRTSLNAALAGMRSRGLIAQD